MVPSRGSEYYEFETFKKRHEILLNEQADGMSYFYLIKDKSGSILGRINLVDIDRLQKIAYLGYRVGHMHTGKGVAKKALELLLETLTDLDIKLVKAKTTTDNVASQRVLENNGFEETESIDKEFEMNGQKLRFVNYIWTNSGLS